MMKNARMKLKLMLVALLPIILFTACSDDDDKLPKSDDQQALTVNGEVWYSHTLYTPDLSYCNDHFVSCIFMRDDNIDILEASQVSFSITLDVNETTGTYYEITKGLDIATSDYVVWGGGNGEFTLNIGSFGDDDYIGASYGGKNKVMSGSGIVEDYEVNDHLTMRFSNLKLALITDDGSQNPYFGDAPETLTLDGTVTFFHTGL